jgi:hypothetical protein
MRARIASILFAAAIFVGFCGSNARGQGVPVFHDPFLNWDFINFTGTNANDFEIIVANPNWVPPQVYTGSLGFPNFTATTGDFVASNPGNETKLSWSGKTFAANSVAHVGAWMAGSGRILDAYWTFNGQKIDGSLGITYELTRVTPLTPGPGGTIAMVLQTTPAFTAANPGSSLQLQGIRTFKDMPATLLGLNDLNENLNLSTLQSFETTPTPSQVTLNSDSFVDVSLGTSQNTNPNFEALLVADMVVVTPSGSTKIGRFWNLNPQSPEPGTAAMVGAAVVLLRRGRRR